MEENFEQEGRGCQVFPSEILSHRAEKHRAEHFVFQKFSGMVKNKIKRAVLRFSVENFLSHMPKNFVGEQFCVLEKVWYEKILSNKWGVSRFSVRKFLSQKAEIFVGNLSTFLKFWGIGKCYAY